MLGAAGNENLRVSDEPAECAGDERARVPRRRNIGIVEHGVTMAAQAPAAARLGLGQQSDEPLAFGTVDQQSSKLVRPPVEQFGVLEFRRVNQILRAGEGVKDELKRKLNARLEASIAD